MALVAHDTRDCYNDPMRDIDTIRLANLLKLLQGMTQAELARTLHKSPAQIQQWASKARGSQSHAARNINTESAREIEQRLGLPENWMDQDHERIADHPSKLAHERGKESRRPSANISEIREVGAWYSSDEPLPDGYVTIEAVKLEVGAGNRLVISEAPEKKLRLYDAHFFVSRRTKPELCKAYRVAGDGWTAR